VDVANCRWVFPETEEKNETLYRVVYLAGEAMEITRRLVARYPRGKLFRNSRGVPWTTDAVNCAFDRIQIRMGRRLMKEQSLEVSDEEIKAGMAILKPEAVIDGKLRPKRPAELRHEAKKKLFYKLARSLAPKYSLYALLEMEYETGHETEQVAPNTAATYSASDRSEGEGERASNRRSVEKPTDLHHRPLRANGHTSTRSSREAVGTLYTVTCRHPCGERRTRPQRGTSGIVIRRFAGDAFGSESRFSFRSLHQRRLAVDLVAAVSLEVHLPVLRHAVLVDLHEIRVSQHIRSVSHDPAGGYQDHQRAHEPGSSSIHVRHGLPPYLLSRTNSRNV